MAKRREQLREAVAQGGLPEIKTRHLLYHVYACKRNEFWRDNLRQVCRARDLFNGKVVIAVAVGNSTHGMWEVKAELDRHWPLWQCSVKLMEFANDPLLREVATFATLLTHCLCMGEHDAVFYGHTKGNTTNCSMTGALIWRNIGYEYLLNRYWELVDPALKASAAVGIHKMCWGDHNVSPYPTKLIRGNWMFAGTFFWFRPMFTHGCDDWRNIPVDRYGAESWLAGLLPKDTVKSVYQIWDEDVWPCPCPYLPGIYPLEDQRQYGSAILL